MVALEEDMVLNGTRTTTLIAPAATVLDTSPRISRRKTLIPLATPTPLVIPIPPGEVVRRKAETTQLVATEEAIKLMAAANEAVMVAEATVMKAAMKSVVATSTMAKKVAANITSTTTTTTRPTVLRG